MATKTTAQQFDPTAFAAPYAETVASVGNAMVESMMQASQAYMDGVLAASQETMNFANHRLDTDVKTCNKLASCGSYEDVAQLQQQWLAGALEDYSRECSRMAEMFSERLNGQGQGRSGGKSSGSGSSGGNKSSSGSQKLAEAAE